MKEYKLVDVFGLSRQIPLTYTHREKVDDSFKESLAKKNHIVIFGCSKQGKTCLRKTHLHDHEFVLIHCEANTTLKDIHRQILNAAGFKQTVKEVKTKGKALKTLVSIGTKFLSIFSAKADVGVDNNSSKQTEEKILEIDLSNTTEVIGVLKSLKFSKYILVDDFHYLNPQTQRDLAFALKSYFENIDILFIIIGVWREENKLISLNRDLIGRTTSINADIWNDNDLTNLIETGTRLLNIQFDEALVENILNHALGSVYFVQEICYWICEENKITGTVITDVNKSGYVDEDGSYISTNENSRFLILLRNTDFKKLSHKIISQYSPNYNSFLRQFDEIDNNNKIFKFIILYVLRNEPYSLVDGIHIKEIISFIYDISPESELNDRGVLFKALKAINSSQLQKGIMPNILDFDEANFTINIIDKGFLIWLSLENRNELEYILNF